MTPRSFDAWVEAECVRLDEEADECLLQGSDAIRRGIAARIISFLAIVDAALWCQLWMPVCVACAVVGGVAVLFEHHFERVDRRANARLWCCAGHMRGLVEAATHPARHSTLIAPVTFENKRREASN